MKGIIVAWPIWGESYIRRWLRIGLGSLLAPGNIPALAATQRLTFMLCTTREDVPMLNAAPEVRALRDLGSVEFVEVAATVEELRQHKYNVMTECHGRALARALAGDQGVIFGLADSLYADGSWAEIARQISLGKRACLTQGIGVLEPTLEPLLAATAVRKGVALSIAPRDLVRLTCQALHPLSDSQRWDSPKFTIWPSMLYWPLGGHGFIMRSWHLYPIFLYPQREATINGTIEGDLVFNSLSNLDDIAYLDDSDRCFFVDVAGPDKLDYIPRNPMRSEPAIVAHWMKTGAEPPLARTYIQRKFWFHDGVERKDWETVERQSDSAIDDVFACYARMQEAAATV